MPRLALRSHLRPALVLTAALIVITGFAYPGVVTGIAQLAFPSRANGSLVTRNGTVVGSELIGQPFAGPQYFHPRPSAAGNGYDATASSGTNKGPTDRKLADTLVAGAVAKAIAEEKAEKGKVPADYATASASGLDPHISPANALLQAARVASARGADVEAVKKLVRMHIEGRQFGLLGEKRVNVLLLNLNLDRELPFKAAASR
jgi:K+-transporting ATPase ATPase C chain